MDIHTKKIGFLAMGQGPAVALDGGKGGVTAVQSGSVKSSYE